MSVQKMHAAGYDQLRTMFRGALLQAGQEGYD